MIRHRLVLASTIVWLSTGTASAQSPSEVLTDVISRNVNLNPIAGHLAGMIVQNTVPTPASEGFTWVLGDDRVGSPTRDWGSMFAEQPQTIGRGRLNVALTYQHVRVDSIAGQSMDNLYTASVIGPLTASTSTTSLDITLDRALVEATFGVTNRLDLGVAVPFGRVAVSGTTVTQFVCTAPGTAACPASSNTPRSMSASTSTSGMGDTLLRAKSNLVSTRPIDLGAGVELRVPTGELTDLLGTGATQVKVAVFGASSHGPVTPHFNVGYTFGGAGTTCNPRNSVNCIQVGPFEPGPEISYTVGVDRQVSRRVNLAADVIGRSLRDAAVVQLASGTVDGLPDTSVQVERGQVTVAFLALGSKVGLGNGWLLKGSVVVPLRDASIRSRVIPMLGIGRAF